MIGFIKRLVLIFPSEEVQENVEQLLSIQDLDYGYEGTLESSCRSPIIIQVVMNADLVVVLIQTVGAGKQELY